MKKSVDSIIDGHKIHLHPEKVSLWNLTGDCYPLHIEVGITGKCNQDCIFCALDFVKNKGVDIDKDVMLRALDDMANPQVQYILSSGEQIYLDRVNSVMFGGEGEPTLHKDLGIFVQYAKKSGLDVALTSNGVGFGKKLQEQYLPYLSWAKFSIDAGTPETYREVHKVPERHFEMLMQNLSDSVRMKREKNLDVTIGTQFLMISENTNPEELEALIRRLDTIGVDYLSIKPYSDHPESKKPLGISQDEYNQLERIIERVRPQVNFRIDFRKETINRINEGNDYSECYGSPFITLIDSRGNVMPCNLFYGQEDFSFGNLYEKGFSEIWTGEKRKSVLGKLRGDKMKDCRHGCRCDAGNRYLARLRNPEAHDNFS